MEASRQFICVRLATYEDADEAAMLKSIFVGRSGEVENTTFAMLAPDGTTRLSRAGRGPERSYGHGPDGGKRMAETMQGLAKRYAPTTGAKAQRALPLCESIRLGLNIAACDHQPLVIVRGDDEAERARLRGRLHELAWSTLWIGRAVYAEGPSSDKVLQSLAGRKPKASFLVVQPGSYGLKGEVLAQADADAAPAELKAMLKAGLAAHRAHETARTPMHVRQGKRAGIHWETEIPVTDPGIGPGSHRGPPHDHPPHDGPQRGPPPHGESR